MKTNLGSKNADNNPRAPGSYITILHNNPSFSGLNIMRKFYQSFKNVDMVRGLQKIYRNTAYNQESLPSFLNNFNHMFHFYSP